MRLLDGTIRTILVDDSLIVAQLMVYICTKFGIANYDEYSLVYDLDSDDGNNTKTATLRRVKFIYQQFLFIFFLSKGTISSKNG
jgi:talin